MACPNAVTQTRKTGSGIAFREAGRGEAVVFIHGLGADGRQWDGQMDGLAGGYRTVALDLRGYGESTGCAPAASLEDYADDVLAVIDAIGVERVHLVGHSMGGRVAQIVLTQHADRLSSVVLYSTWAGGEPELALSDDFVVSRRQPFERGGGFPDIAEGIITKHLASGARAEVRQTFRKLILNLRRDGYLQAVQALAASKFKLDPKAVEMPALIIGACEDKSPTPDILRALAASIKDAEFVLLDGAAHVANLEQPEAFAAALVRFFDQLERSS